MGEWIVAGVLWVACSALVAFVAFKRGKYPLAWLILAVLLSPFLVGIALLILPAPQDERARAQWGRVPAACVLIPGLAIAYILWLANAGVDLGIVERGFTDADITAAKASIKAEFEKRANTLVKDVVLVRENKRKLVGFAKMVVPGTDFELTKSCTATFGDNSYVWQCN